MTYRNQNQAWVAGVAAGLSEKYHIPLSLIRGVFLAFFMLFGIGLVIYMLAWSRMPSGTNQIGLNFN